jgi:DNA-binding winged helix-turn-helix (wHTH) protein
VVEVELRLLGPLLVQHDGATVPVPPGKQRVLLAALLLRANCVVPLDDLTEALWGHDPPPSVHATLRNHVKRLRRTLAGTGEPRIRTLPGGYLIEVLACELDVIWFEALQGSAREAARRGSWDRAADQLRTALSFWRGEPLVDVPSEWLALREVPRLAEMRLQAVVVISAIAGTAGVGKTTLALRWAHQVADRFPDGQLYVNLRGFDPSQPVAAADALASFLRTLGVASQDIPADAEERSARYRGLLAGRRVLLLLDNAGSAEQGPPET